MRRGGCSVGSCRAVRAGGSPGRRGEGNRCGLCVRRGGWGLCVGIGGSWRQHRPSGRRLRGGPAWSEMWCKQRRRRSEATCGGIGGQRHAAGTSSVSRGPGVPVVGFIVIVRGVVVRIAVVHRRVARRQRRVVVGVAVGGARHVGAGVAAVSTAGVNGVEAAVCVPRCPAAVPGAEAGSHQSQQRRVYAFGNATVFASADDGDGGRSALREELLHVGRVDEVDECPRHDAVLPQPLLTERKRKRLGAAVEDGGGGGFAAKARRDEEGF
mmetsp:Transcript_49571/g.153034  ORF Transcript_49571/g.153034 Transcript_49571/m.153034 type:complete len:268 (+) Transcript_49571:2113-2916(+)